MMMRTKTMTMMRLRFLLLCLAATFLAVQSNDTTEAADSESEIETEGIEVVYAVLMPWFVQAVGVVVFYILTRHVHAVPYTCVLFVTGTLMGVGAVRTGNSDQLTESVTLWTNINAEVLFTVFLPGLLFKDALEINFHLFLASFWQLILLAFPMVLAGTMLTALTGMYVLPYDWTFHHALTFGSILAATDPVAVSALLNEVGAPPRLKTHVSGEVRLDSVADVAVDVAVVD
jgi:NhaP-type Na+/H+ or K+/H+ antiporter